MILYLDEASLFWRLAGRGPNHLRKPFLWGQLSGWEKGRIGSPLGLGFLSRKTRSVEHSPTLHVSLPQALKTLILGRRFNRFLGAVKWPSCLQTLVFGEGFNRGLHKTMLPGSLRHLEFGDCFNKGVSLPKGLEYLAFGNQFNQWEACPFRTVWNTSGLECLPTQISQTFACLRICTLWNSLSLILRSAATPLGLFCPAI